MQQDPNNLVITWFDDFHGPNPHRFLSNFYEGEPLHDGFRAYLTGEHMFAAYKTLDRQQHEMIAAAADAQEAKHLGRTVDLRPDWEVVKYDVMRFVLALKFALGREEATWLLETGDMLLVEGTYWGDTVWGVDLNKDRHSPEHLRPGRNWLGSLLMARRAELRAEVAGVPAFDYSHVARFSRGQVTK
jgi:ribA/ribD-fused uncharacterized protein